jgi:hypothetical protein
MIDHEFANASGHERFDMPDNQGLPTRLQQGLWAIVSEWAHAFAPARRQDHRAHGTPGLKM